MIVELIAHSCQLHKDQFDATDDEAADRLIHCANAALPYLSVSTQLYFNGSLSKLLIYVGVLIIQKLLIPHLTDYLTLSLPKLSN